MRGSCRIAGFIIVFVITPLAVSAQGTMITETPAAEAPPAETVSATAAEPDPAETVAFEAPSAETLPPESPAVRVWAFDDGVGVEEVPWDEFDPLVHYRPKGLVHAGVEVRVAALLGGPEPLGAGPLVEALVFMDARFAPLWPFRIRIAAVVSGQPSWEYRGGSGNVTWGSPLGLRARLFPLAVDFGQFVSWRLGGDIGVQYAPYGAGRGHWEMFPAFSTELVGRVLEGRLELGAIVGAQWTAIGVSDRSGDHVELEAQAVLGGLVSYVFP
jgi:hypothetical protein